MLLLSHFTKGKGNKIMKKFDMQYEVNPLTMAIFTKQELNGQQRTFVMEEDEEISVNGSPLKLIEYACLFFGASLKGRQEGTRGICGITHKTPITIDPSSGMYFFPTNSPKNPKCAWISHSHIDKVRKRNGRFSEIVFKNGKTIVINVSYGSMLNQVQRTAHFRFLLDERIMHLQKLKKAEMVAETYSKDPE